MQSEWQLAQINVATARFPFEDPRIGAFVEQLDTINALADASPGFVWRLQDDNGNATDVDTGRGARFIANMSVWESIEALGEFVYRSAHRDVMVRRRQWFEPPAGRYQVLWWVPAGHRPTLEEGLWHLDLLNEAGPGPRAVTFRDRYPPPGVEGGEHDFRGGPEPLCPGVD